MTLICGDCNLDVVVKSQAGIPQRTNERFQQDVFRFQIAMYESRVFKDRERIEELSHEHFDELGAQALELILLDQFVKIARKQLEDKAKMTSVDKGVAQSKNVMFVGWIAVFIELLTS